MDSKNMHILIVDDDENIREMMAFILEDKGYQTTTANDGLHAIELVQESSFDVIFMDIKMPRLNGVEAFKRIKRIRSEVKVIMMTAYKDTRLAVEAIQEGAIAIIHKPLEFDRIYSLLNRIQYEKDSAFILVVDDDENIRSLLKELFTKQGYRVTVAKNGEEAVAMSQIKLHDISIIDINLPSLNGLETFLAIQNIDPQARVILMTGQRERKVDELIKTALDNNAYTCIYKPFDPLALIEVVNDICSSKFSVV